jgi:prepilin-type N-terminal cleavage/methylation domain-containing protein
MSQPRRAFTMLELVIAVAIMVILSYFVYVNVGHLRAQSKLTRVSNELATLSQAMTLYAQDNNYQYPPDVSRGLPSGLQLYLANSAWPTSVWPYGVYDWDNWTHPVNGQQIYQMSYRLCDLNNAAIDPKRCTDPILFPNFTVYSAIYFCAQGPCIPHHDDINAPAYCVNCVVKKVNY